MDRSSAQFFSARPVLPRLVALTALPILLLLSPSQALAGSATADSVWNRQSALNRALQQVPAGAEVTGNRCEQIGVAGSTRHRCTVFFRTDPAEPPSAAP